MAAQFEQSVLDAKDKEQLIAIAQALGIKANARMAKATLIDKILEATGVTAAADEPAAAPAAAEPAPSASRPPAAADDAAGAAAAPGAPDTAEHAPSRDDDADEGDESDDDGDEGDADGDADGEGEGGGKRRRRRRRKPRGEATGPERFDAPPSLPKPEGAVEFVPQEPVEVAGLLDLRDEGYGFLRVAGYLPTRDDAYVSLKLVRQYGLRRGDHVAGLSRAANRSEKNPALLEVRAVNGADPELARSRARFDDSTAQYPDEQLVLAGPDDGADLTARAIDLIAPLGKGQRGLLVCPPGVDRTAVLAALAGAIERTHPEAVVRVLLLDERPEEITEVRRAIEADVVATTFDRPAEEHTLIAELMVEQAKRQVEAGDDVVLLVDGLTRLGRAYLAAAATERTGGVVDSAALYPLKRFFGAARTLAEGGSLTIVATLSVDTNSRTDEVIAEEVVGLQNWEVRLDRGLASRAILPPIDVAASGTSHEDRLIDADRRQRMVALRRIALGDTGAAPGEGMAELLRRIAASASNDRLLAER